MKIEAEIPDINRDEVIEAMARQILTKWIGEQLSAEHNAAHDLWTWLPSYKIAQKHHRDYALEYCPSNRDVMVEAAMYLAHTRGAGKTLTPEEEVWFSRCPCGEDHQP